jgi:DNA-binding NtrC family response regulator
MKYNLLFVDDNPELLSSVKFYFELQGYSVTIAKTSAEAISLVQRDPFKYAVVVIDYGINNNNGATLLASLKNITPDLLMLIYSGNSSRDATRLSIQAGALDYIDKGPNFDSLESAIEQLCQKYEETVKTFEPSTVNSENEELISSIGLIGCSNALADVARKVLLYRATKKNVLVLGESGVGKKLVAQALHEGDLKNYYLKNCADYSHDSAMLRSELFGHVKGSFTTATTDKCGIFEAAKGGTVFLDEIHELAPEAQSMLLIAVEDKKVQRLGANQFQSVNFRLVAAAKPDLKERVDNGLFKFDLYSRLNVFSIEIPPLKERPEDIEPLVHFFCEKFFEETGKKKAFLMGAIQKLKEYSWPGNIRELEHTIESILIHSTTPKITLNELPRHFFNTKHLNELPSYKNFKRKQEEEEKAYVSLALRKWKSQKRAAKELGIPRSTFGTIVEKFGVKNRPSLNTRLK